MMHGRIRVQSREGHGATFSLTLPLRPAPLPKPGPAHPQFKPRSDKTRVWKRAPR